MHTDPEIPIKDWPDFVKCLLEFDHDDLACRGEPRKYCEMKPQLDRLILGKNLSQRLGIERDVCQRFREHAPVHLNAFEREYLKTPWLQLVVMQHYAAPTRLLDWTKSPWVAAFFAASAEPKEDGYVYVFRRNPMEKMINDRFPKDLSSLVHGRPTGGKFTTPVWDEADANEDLFYEDRVKDLDLWVATFYSRKTHFPRLVAQQGIFTFASKPDTDHWDRICEQTMTSERRTFKICASAKARVLRGLNIAGLNGATLFPGVDGIGRSLEGFIQTRYLT